MLFSLLLSFHLFYLCLFLCCILCGTLFYFFFIRFARRVSKSVWKASSMHKLRVRLSDQQLCDLKSVWNLYMTSKSNGVGFSFLFFDERKCVLWSILLSWQCDIPIRWIAPLIPPICFFFRRTINTHNQYYFLEAQSFLRCLDCSLVQIQVAIVHFVLNIHLISAKLT